jgi:hypothetical protein
MIMFDALTIVLKASVMRRYLKRFGELRNPVIIAMVVTESGKRWMRWVIGLAAEKL